jgi:hypothetical protein
MNIEGGTYNDMPKLLETVIALPTCILRLALYEESLWPMYGVLRKGSLSSAGLRWIK